VTQDRESCAEKIVHTHCTLRHTRCPAICLVHAPPGWILLRHGMHQTVSASQSTSANMFRSVWRHLAIRVILQHQQLTLQQKFSKVVWWDPCSRAGMCF
jgi:hypothetical protein